MSGALEGDLIRPLGLVTLYFGYAEAQVISLVSMLHESGVAIEVSPVASLGQRLKAFELALATQTLPNACATEVKGLLEESKALIEQRNALVHACILAKGRVIPNDPAKVEFRVTPDQLTDLAERAFNWKERLNSTVQLRLLPALRQSGGNDT